MISHLSPAWASDPQLRTVGSSLLKTSARMSLYTPDNTHQHTLFKRHFQNPTGSWHHQCFYAITCRSDSMPSKLLSRLRSTVSPLRSRSICSRIPSTVRLWTAPSLTMCVRNNSSPVSLTTCVCYYSNTCSGLLKSSTTKALHHWCNWPVDPL